MDFGQYTLGRVVKDKDPLFFSKPPFEGKLGHITGFSSVEYGTRFSVILLVKWFDGTETPIHPSRVELL